MSDCKSEKIALQHILTNNEILDHIDEQIEEFFQKTKIVEWLLPSQAKMISEILSSGNNKNIVNRFKSYEELQNNRESRWSKIIDNDKSSISMLIELITNLNDNFLKSKIKEGFEYIRLAFDKNTHRAYIDELLIRQFDYLFTLKFRLKYAEKREVLVCLKN